MAEKMVSVPDTPETRAAYQDGLRDGRAEGFKAGQENMRERAAWHEKQRGKGKEE